MRPRLGPRCDPVFRSEMYWKAGAFPPNTVSFILSAHGHRVHAYRTMTDTCYMSSRRRKGHYRLLTAAAQGLNSDTGDLGAGRVPKVFSTPPLNRRLRMLETCLTSAVHLVQKEDATGQCPHSSTVAWMVGWVGEVRDGGPMGRGATWGVGGPMGRGARWGSWWPAGDGGRTRSVRGTRGANGPGRILRGHADTRDEGVAGREGTVGWGTIGGGGRKARGTAEGCL